MLQFVISFVFHPIQICCVPIKYESVTSDCTKYHMAKLFTNTLDQTHWTRWDSDSH